MGCTCCSVQEEINNNIESKNIIKILNEEYKSFLIFLNKIKTDLNSSIQKDKDSSNNINNLIINKNLYIIPLNWFEKWEKRIKEIVQDNKYKNFDLNFEYKNYENKIKFYYELFDDDSWAKIYRNKIYKLKECKQKTVLICNNLIIFHYEKPKYYIEIFFFKEENDLFFSNLLFSFEKCDDDKREYFNFLNILKKSPIQEIFGNMHYDYSKEFVDKNKKIIVYNKTRQVNEEIKNFRINQYELLFKHSSIKETVFNNDEIKEENDNEDIIENYSKIKNLKQDINNKNNKNQNIQFRNENNLMGNTEFSAASTNMMLSNQNLFRNQTSFNNISGIKLFKLKESKEKKDINHQNKEENNNKNNSINKYASSQYKKNLLIHNKLALKSKKNSRNLLISNNGEISTFSGNKYKRTNFFGNLSEEKESKSLFESIIYCLFHIEKLTNYLIDKEITKNIQNSFYKEYLNIIQFLYKKNRIDNDINNINEKSENEYNLIKDCPNYNYEKIYNLIYFQEVYNIISKIINKLHIELNKSKKKEEIGNINNFNEIDLNPNDQEDNDKNLNIFIKKYREINNSIIFDLFYGIKKIKIFCTNCQKTKVKYEMINIIEFYTEKLIKYYKENKIKKKNNINIINNTITELSIEECLNIYQKEEIQKDKTVFNCPSCNDYYEYKIFNEIYKYPEILILNFYFDNFNLSENEEELKIYINLNLHLLNDNYELIGIISIKNNEETNDYAYIAYCKDYTINKWLFYDEDKIIDFNLNDNINNIFPIALFYQKIKE